MPKVNRTKLLSIRLTEPELEKLRTMAEESGEQNVSQYMRRALLGGDRLEKVEADLRQIEETLNA